MPVEKTSKDFIEINEDKAEQDPIQLQINNVKLQRHIQFLQQRIHTINVDEKEHEKSIVETKNKNNKQSEPDSIRSYGNNEKNEE